MGRWMMERVGKKNGKEGSGKEGERKRDKEIKNIIVLRELLASLHPKIFPALRIADVINDKHKAPLISKCLINAFPSLTAATTQGS